MRKSIGVFLPALVLSLLLPAASAMAKGDEAHRVQSAGQVLAKIMEIPEKAIPPALLTDARAIAIVPGVIKVGYVLGGQYGRGVLVVREENGSWSDPLFVTLVSGSVGWQIGAESTDFVLVFKSPRSIDGVLKGKFTLGADAAGAAGPVGRHAEAATDVQMKAEVYSYSRSRGLFAGVSLEGSSIQIDDRSDAAFYGKKGVTPAEIVAGKGIWVPAAADKLDVELGRYAPAPARS